MEHNVHQSRNANSQPKSLALRAYEAYNSGSFSLVAGRAQVFLRRRYYRFFAGVESISADIDVLDRPQEAIAGSMYRLQVRITNRSNIIWNSSNDDSPRFSVAAFLLTENAVTETSHSILPSNLAPGSHIDLPILFEVPRFPCNLRIQIDVVRENCYWLSELGNPSPQFTLPITAHSHESLAASMPTIDVTLDVTNKCPLKCIQCRKTYFETFDEQQDMDFEIYHKIAKEIFPYARSVSLSSAGEPLMTRNFLQAVSVARKYGVDVSFISSGMHLDHHRAEQIVELGVGRVEFSIDGASAAVYNRIRIGSNFDKVIKNIAYLTEVKKKMKSHTPLLRFNFVLMKSNIHELPDFIDLAHRLAVEEVQTQHMVIFVDQLKDEALIFHKEMSNQYIVKAREKAQFYGIRFYHPPLFKIDRNDGSGDDVKPVNGQIWVQADAYDYERVTHPKVPEGMQLCTDPWRKVFVDWQGFVFPCCVWKEPPLGDLKKNTFLEIWNSERYRALRSGLTTGDLGKSCSTCSVITGGDIDNERSYFFSS